MIFWLAELTSVQQHPTQKAQATVRDVARVRSCRSAGPGVETNRSCAAQLVPGPTKCLVLNKTGQTKFGEKVCDFKKKKFGETKSLVKKSLEQLAFLF